MLRVSGCREQQDAHAISVSHPRLTGRVNIPQESSTASVAVEGFVWKWYFTTNRDQLL